MGEMNEQGNLHARALFGIAPRLHAAQDGDSFSQELSPLVVSTIHTPLC